MKLSNGYRMRLVIIGIMAAVSVCDGNAKADFTWTQKADMPTPRWMHTSATVNGKIYVIGGASSEPVNWQTEPTEVLSTVEEYNPATDTWTRKADMPTARGWLPPSSPVVDDKIYVIGGIGTDDVNWLLSTVEVYDPTTDTWMCKADMPTPRWSLATCSVDGKIYTIGGASNSYRGLSVVEEYDPSTDTWTRKADITLGVWGLCACVVDGKIYALGGRRDAQARSYLQEYDPVTDTWTRKANTLERASSMAAAVVCDKIIVAGGWLWSKKFPYTTVQVYDPETNTWIIETDAPFLRTGCSSSVVNNTMYVIGGTDRPHPCPATSTVYALNISSQSPPPDFNCDGIVDSADVCIMVDHWGEDYSLCDIAPPPCGDGIVDVQDLITFCEHLFEEVSLPIELIAYWKLDEIEGAIAYNSIGDKDAILFNGPVWRPDEGKRNGSLELDGINDYVSTPFILNPSEGPFSIFVWIKGVELGQVIISQTNRSGTGETWLNADSLHGTLTTSLSAHSGRSVQPPLVSEFLITDDEWHHIGFVWDGSYRALYLDGIEAAKDAVVQNPLKSATGSLYFGTDKNLSPASFLSGLIDDVRIYTKALSAEEITALSQ